MEPGAPRLNVGCGQRFLGNWINLDFVANEPCVQEHDLRKPLPFESNHFSVVYHSHVLEHLDRGDACRLLQECHRVMRPGGVLRVVVPDLEHKARLYLEKLAGAVDLHSERQIAEHEWMVIEIIDQMVRTRPGGAMIDFMRHNCSETFVRERIGDEYDRARTPVSHPAPLPSRATFSARLRAGLRTMALQVLRLNEEELAYLGFRRSGELHLWMYDRVSLGRALAAAGFAEFTIESAGTSRIHDWGQNGVSLDMQANVPRKPDSLYMEAIKRR